jgi:hypothetical protein
LKWPSDSVLVPPTSPPCKHFCKANTCQWLLEDKPKHHTSCYKAAWGFMDNLVALGTPTAATAAVAANGAHCLGASIPHVLAFSKSKSLAPSPKEMDPKSHACTNQVLPYEAAMGPTTCTPCNMSFIGFYFGLFSSQNQAKGGAFRVF